MNGQTPAVDAPPQRAVVAIVDAYFPTRRLADEFIAAGYDCVRVQSTPEVPAVYRSTFSTEKFAANLVHDGDFDAVVKALVDHRPVAVVAGGEIGVEYADRLSEALGLPTNGTALSAARRDKFTMIETIKAAGVAGSEQLLVTGEDELRRWHQRLGRRAVLKPIRSTGGDGIYFCDTPEQSVAAYRALAGSDNFFSRRNEGVVAQEYLQGGEYVVNTVSRDGVVLVTDVWKTHRVTINGVLDMCDAVELLDPARDEVHQLSDYARQVLAALGIRQGPGHLEVKLTPAGPRLVEIGARIAGGDIPYYASVGTGHSQLDRTVDAYVRPDRFDQAVVDGVVRSKSVTSVAMLSPTDGTLAAYPQLEAVKQLESVFEVRPLVQPGQKLSRTVDDTTYPMIVNLAHEVAEVVSRDYGTLRYLDGAGFYQLA